MSRFLIILCTFSAFYEVLHAQNNYTYSSSRVLHYNDENGLPQNSAKELLFDENGLLWVGTESGLVIYDGSNFIYPKGIEEDAKMDYSFLDKDGNILFYDGKSNIYKVTKGSQTLHRVHEKENDAHRYLFPSIYKNRRAIDSALFKFYFLSHYLGQDNKITVDGKRDATFIQNDLDFSERRYSYFVFNDYIFKLYKNKDVYARHKNKEEWKYITQSGINLDINFGNNSIYTGLIFTGEDHIFISDNHKIYRVTFDGKNLHSEVYIDYVPFNHIEDKIFVADYDSKHDVFAFGSQNKGLFIVTGTNFVTASVDKPNNDKFDDYNNVFYSQAVLPDNVIVTGTGYKQNRKNHKNLFRFRPTYHYNRALIFDDKKINANITDKRTITIYDYPTKKSYSLSLPEQYNSFKCITGTEEGQYYFAIETELYQFTKAKEFKKVSEKLLFKDNQIRQLHDHSEQYLWIISEQGILKYHKSNQTFDTILQSRNLDIQHVSKLGPDMYLAGTYGNGYYAIYKEKVIKMPLDQKQYLKYTHTFLKDYQGFLWISSNKGLFQVAEEDVVKYILNQNTDIYYQYYDKTFGFETNEFNGRCLNPGVMTYDSLISLSSMSGLVQFYPASIKARLPDAPLLITSIRIDSLDVDNMLDNIELEPDFKELKLKISSPYYGHPDNLNIEYKLNGYHNTWQKLNNLKEIKIQNLGYGNYTLQIRKKTGFGPDNVALKNLKITVKPYFYQTWWFFMLMLFLFIGWMFIFSSIYYRVILKQKDKLSRLVDERTLELKSTNKVLSDTNEQNNLLLSVLIHDIKAPMKIVQNVTEDMRAVWNKISESEKLEMIQDVSNTTKKINQFMFQFIGYIKSQKTETLNYEACNLRNLIDDIISFHDQDEKIKSLTIKITNEIPDALNLKSDIQLLKIIINNIVDNSIKFSTHGHIILKADQDKNFTYISCEDHGKGMDQEKIDQILSSEYKANSIRPDSYRLGYAFIKNIVKKFNGKLTIKSSLDSGTMVMVTLPRIH